MLHYKMSGYVLLSVLIFTQLLSGLVIYELLTVASAHRMNEQRIALLRGGRMPDEVIQSRGLAMMDVSK